MTREFTFEKATKNTYRFQEQPDDNGLYLAGLTEPGVGAIYVRKAVFPGHQPKAIRVTIEEVAATP